MSNDGRLAKKRVLVTGGGTGLGRGIAWQCAQAGADVVVHYGRSRAGAEEIVDKIRSEGRRAQAIAADLADLNQVASLAENTSEFLGGLDVLVNNAGVTTNVPFAQATPEQFDHLYQVNIRAGYFLTQAVLSQLTDSRGAVINITSIHAFEGMSEHTLYAGTKGAIVATTRALAIELAPVGIRVNAIAPGCIPVENYAEAIGEYDVDEIGRTIPVGHVGTPADVGKAVVFLASDDGRFIVGQTLILDGGTTSWLPFGEQFRQPIAATGIQFGKGYVPGL